MTRPRPIALVVLAALGVVAVAIVASAASSGGFYWEDDYTHLQLSRLALRDPRWMLDVWGRPLMTIAYMPAVEFGEGAVRATSLALLAMTAATCVGIARARPMPLAPAAALLLVGQPLTAQIGYSALPYTVFSFVLAVALWLRARGRTAAAALVASVLPLARLEGLLVLVLWAGTLLRERRRAACVLLTVGLVLWNGAGALLSSDPVWLWHANPYGVLGSRYRAAGWGYVLTALPTAAGPVVAALAVVGLVTGRVADRLWQHLLAAFLVFYAVVWGVPAFQSFGDPVYLVTASVPIALCALGGLGAIGGEPTSAVSRPAASPRAAAVLIGVLACAGVSLHATRALPLRGGPRLCKQIAADLGPRTTEVALWSEPAFGWFAKRLPSESWSALDRLPVGALVLWDTQFGRDELRTSEDRMRALGFEPVRELHNRLARVVLWVRRTAPRDLAYSGGNTWDAKAWLARRASSAARSFARFVLADRARYRPAAACHAVSVCSG